MTYLALIGVLMLVGCQSIPATGSRRGDLGRLEEAGRMLDEGEFFRARSVVSQVLLEHPESRRAQKLMADAISLELERYKAVNEEKVPEEWTETERSAEARTWIERAGLLLQAGEYEQAVLAAEQVFFLKPGDPAASGLIDRIREEAFRNGKKDLLILGQMRREEIEERVARYRREAAARIEEGQWTVARLMLEKWLLLSPRDPEALRLHRELLSQVGGQ